MKGPQIELSALDVLFKDMTPVPVPEPVPPAAPVVPVPVPEITPPISVPVVPPAVAAPAPPKLPSSTASARVRATYLKKFLAWVAAVKKYFSDHGL